MGDGPAECMKSQAVIRRMIAHNILMVGQDVYYDLQKKTYRGLVGEDGCIHLGIDRFGSPNVFATYIYRKILDVQGVKMKKPPTVNGWEQVYTMGGMSLAELRMRLPEHLRGLDDDKPAASSSKVESADDAGGDQDEAKKRVTKRKRGDGGDESRSGRKRNRPGSPGGSGTGGPSEEDGSESGEDVAGDTEGEGGQAGGSSGHVDADGGDDGSDAEAEDSKDKGKKRRKDDDAGDNDDAESRGGDEEDVAELQEEQEPPPPTRRSKKAAQPAESEEEEEDSDWKVLEKEHFFMAIKDNGRADLSILRNAVRGRQAQEVEQFYENIVQEIREWYQPTGFPCGLDGDAKEQAKTFLLWWEAMKRLEWLQDAKKELQSEVEELKEQVEAEIEEKLTIQKTKTKLESEVKELRKSMKNEQKNRQLLEESKKRAEKEAERLRKDGDKSLALQKTNRKLEQKIEDMKREFKSENDTRSDTERQIRLLRKQLDEERKARAEEIDVRRRLESNLEKAKKRMEVLYTEIDTARSAEAQSKQMWTDGRRKIEAQVAQLQKAIEGLRAHKKNLESRIQHLSETIKVAKPDWSEAQLPPIPEFQEPILPVFDFSTPRGSRPSNEAAPAISPVDMPASSPKDVKEKPEPSAMSVDRVEPKKGEKVSNQPPAPVKPVVAHRRKGIPVRAPRPHDTLPGGILNFNYRDVIAESGVVEDTESS